MSRDPVVSLRAAAKSYKLYDAPADRLREALFPGRKRHVVFPALQPVSLDIPAGQTVASWVGTAAASPRCFS